MLKLASDFFDVRAKKFQFEILLFLYNFLSASVFIWAVGFFKKFFYNLCIPTCIIKLIVFIQMVELFAQKWCYLD